jgi:hypothetical protein
MSPQVSAAIVSGLFTVGGALITFFVTKFFEQRHLLPIAGDRRKSLVGHWKGKISQPNVGDYDLEMNLNVTKNKVSGLARLGYVEDGKPHSIPLSLEGGFFYDRFLKVDYKNTDSAKIQFGSITLHVSSTSNSMNGKFSGYGSISEAVVGGDILLEKIASQ